VSTVGRRQWVAMLTLAVAFRLPLVNDGWFGPDKLKHFFMTAVLQSFAYSAAQAAGADSGDAMRIGLAAAGVAAVGREIYDARSKQRFSIPDLVWDAGGGVAATAMLRHTR
jgi:uncharacterized protein YfiM (DUF2279 family)